MVVDLSSRFRPIMTRKLKNGRLEGVILTGGAAFDVQRKLAIPRSQLRRFAGAGEGAGQVGDRHRVVGIHAERLLEGRKKESGETRKGEERRAETRRLLLRPESHASLIISSPKVQTGQKKQ